MIERRRNSHRTAYHPTKIQQALELLNEAAQEKREELFETLNGQYEDFRDVLEDVNKNVQRRASNIRKKGETFMRDQEEKIEKTAAKTKENVEKRIHKRPWLAMSSVALSAWLVGFAMGKK